MRPPEAGRDEPLVLALDTASASGGVALVRGRAVLGETSWQVGGQQTSEVLPATVRLWERAGITAGDLDAVAVSAGPGSYTGLRVGFSLAKGMALARGLPVVAIPTLEAVAYQHRDAAARLCAVVDAGRGQLYVARFERGQILPRQRGQVAVLDPGRASRAPGGRAAPPARLWRALPAPDRLPAGGGCPGRAVRLPRRAPSAARHSWRSWLSPRLAAGAVGDPAPLQPLYLRRPV